MSTVPLVLVVVYLAWHSLLVVRSGCQTGRMLRLLLINLGLGLAAAVMLATLPERPDEAGALWFNLVLWAPVVFFWWAYLWSSHTLHAFHPPGRTWDTVLIRWEDRIGQPSLNWARTPRPWLNELLHAGYFSYYLYTPVLGIWLQAKGDPAGFQSMSAAVCGGYLLSYALFAVIPVAGPRWSLVEAGRLDPARVRGPGGVLTRLTYRILYDGPAIRGGAMPSSHTATAVVFVVWTWRLGGAEPGVAAMVLVLAMAAGAIYGRYHFATDIVAGAVVGGLAVVAADHFVPWAPLA